MHTKEKLEVYRLLAVEKWKELKVERIKEYNKNPQRCKLCKNAIPYESLKNGKLSKRKFCSQSCNAKYNNRLRYQNKIKYCLYCKKENKKDFCSQACKTQHRWDEILKIIKTTNSIPGTFWSKQSIARKYMLETYGNICSECKLEIWNNKPIPLVLDHIDGNHQNFDLQNLRLLCRNCDAQTDTFCSKNKGRGREHRRKQSRSIMV